MRVVQINQVSGYGSTGAIVESLSGQMMSEGIDNLILFGMGETLCPQAQRFGTSQEQLCHKIFSRITGFHGAGSKRATREMIAAIEGFQPSVIHLHNLHGFYINLELLFDYLLQKQLPIVWTLHDCWSFTGHCAHFTYVGCERWKSGCENCPQRMAYPKTVVDRSIKNFALKKELFTGLTNCSIVTPSYWLSELTKQSFLGCHPIQIIPNGIDLNVFIGSPKVSSKNSIKRVLASATTLDYGDRKGGWYLAELAEKLGPRYLVQVLGLKKKNRVPTNLEALPYVCNQEELAKYYAAADVFVNTTIEDNFPSVNLEALACGTPVVTFNTGGSPETIDKTCGSVVQKENIIAMVEAVEYWVNRDAYLACRKRAELFRKEVRFKEYIKLYNKITRNE